ncbi:hypothetical protein ABZW18_26895 [Streptomyces sp. NPDC004647]|uniref:hypothetical protein n=1 Tax=Streptomyces sp. NPDC004647 TaxID=3154671 RepID=UPI0033B7613F
MRTSVKLSVMAIAVAAMLGASASAATAHDKWKSDDPSQVNFCGNVEQEASAEDEAILAGLEQEAEGPVFCQNGENNTAVNWTPEFTFIDVDLAP